MSLVEATSAVWAVGLPTSVSLTYQLRMPIDEGPGRNRDVPDGTVTDPAVARHRRRDCRFNAHSLAVYKLRPECPNCALLWVTLRMPFRAGPAHVVELGPIGVPRTFDQLVPYRREQVQTVATDLTFAIDSAFKRARRQLQDKARLMRGAGIPGGIAIVVGVKSLSPSDRRLSLES